MATPSSWDSPWTAVFQNHPGRIRDYPEMKARRGPDSDPDDNGWDLFQDDKDE
jgi:hypothetical protein